MLFEEKLDLFTALLREGLGASRFDLKYSAGTLPHESMLRSIELYGTEVAPLVRELLPRSEAA